MSAGVRLLHIPRDTALKPRAHFAGVFCTNRLQQRAFKTILAEKFL